MKRITRIGLAFSLLWTALVLLPTGGAVLAQNYSGSKTINKSFKVSAVTTVDLSNKYGKVHIISHDADSARFEIFITAQTNEKGKLNEILNSVKVGFTATTYYITAKTEIGQKPTGIFGELRQLTNELLDTESNVRANYTLYLPDYVNLKLSNKFGDVFVEDLKGNFDMKLSNGDFKIDNLTGRVDLDLKFCKNGSINSVKNGNILAAYSEITINQAEQLNIDSKSSRIRIESINVLKTRSRRDKYVLGAVKHMYGDTYFSDIQIGAFDQEFSFDMKYGNLNMEHISDQFSLIHINSSYTDISLYFDKTTCYDIELIKKNVNLNLPSELANVSEQVDEKDDKISKTTGKIGKGVSTGKLRIQGEGSTINILHK